MSSPTNPVDEPNLRPSSGVPKAVPRTPEPSSRRWVWFVAPAVVICALLGYRLFLRPKADPAGAMLAVRTVKVTRGSLQRTLRLSGITAAKNFASIAIPLMRGPDSGRNLLLMYLAKSGSFVKKGDMISQVDTQTQKDHVEDVTAMVVQAEADIRKRKAEQAIEWENLLQTVRNAKASRDKAKLDLTTAPIRTPIDAELLKLGLEEGEAQYKQVQADLETKKRVHASEIKILELTRDRHVRHRDRHASDIDRLTLYAPMNGLVVMQSVFRGGEFAQIQEGDQVSPGQPFVKVVDTSSMMVDATVNQVEAESLRLGQRGTVEFDAFPGLRLAGRVHSIGAIAVGGWRVNYYIRNVPVRVQIEGSDPRVIPDLSASASIQIDNVDKALVIPLEAVTTERGKHFVEVRTGLLRFARREVTLGLRSNTHAVAVSGVKEGEELAVGRTLLAAAQ